MLSPDKIPSLNTNGANQLLSHGTATLIAKGTPEAPIAIVGCNPPNGLGCFGRTTVGCAVMLAGQGHVVCHSHAGNFWEGINGFTASPAYSKYGQQSWSIGLYNNDSFNCVCHPLSVQPFHVGPVYWIRNIVWNAYGGISAIKNVLGTQVLLFLHNTSSTHMKTPTDHPGVPADVATTIVQNNLSIGPLKRGTVLQYIEGNASPKYVISHNAYRKDAASAAFLVGKDRYESLEALRQATGHECGSLEVDCSVLQSAAEPPHGKMGTPLIYPDTVGLSPADGSPLIDAGTRIAGVNDTFAASAPDIGALGKGLPGPVYGPRHEDLRKRLEAWNQTVRTNQETKEEGN